MTDCGNNDGLWELTYVRAGDNRRNLDGDNIRYIYRNAAAFGGVIGGVDCGDFSSGYVHSGADAGVYSEDYRGIYGHYAVWTLYADGFAEFFNVCV
jgi:hypothetical protein